MDESPLMAATLSWVLIAGDFDVEEGVRLARTAAEGSNGYFARLRDLPGVPGALHALALGLAKQERWDEAREVASRAAEVLPARPQFDELVEKAIAGRH